MTLIDKLFGQVRDNSLGPTISFGRDAFIERRYLRNSHRTILEDCKISATTTLGAISRLNSRAEVRSAREAAVEERRVKEQRDPRVALPDAAVHLRVGEAVADLRDVCPALFGRVVLTSSPPLKRSWPLQESPLRIQPEGIAAGSALS
jgi:hypothetical protein